MLISLHYLTLYKQTVKCSAQNLGIFDEEQQPVWYGGII